MGREPSYERRDVEISLRLFEAVRALNVEILHLASAGALTRSYRQSDYGRRTLDQLLCHRADHDLPHLLQIASG